MIEKRRLADEKDLLLDLKQATKEEIQNLLESKVGAMIKSAVKRANECDNYLGRILYMLDFVKSAIEYFEEDEDQSEFESLEPFRKDYSKIDERTTLLNEENIRI